MAERVAAEDRLSRILYLLPVAGRKGGVTIAELAAALGVGEREIMADIAELTAREDYLPGGSVPDIQVWIEQDRIHAWTTGGFKRPVRLSPRETLALGLGLRALAAEAEPARRAELLALATRLEASLAAPVVEPEVPMDRALSFAGFDLDTDDEDLLSIIVDAARARRVCRVRYLKAGAAAPEERVLHPYHLVHAEGRWYLLAHSVERAGVRIFRIDRILAAVPLDERFEVPDDFDPARYVAEGGRLFSAEGDIEVVVRYSPRIARWIEERVSCEARSDGSVVVRHRVADPRWIVRHVLQYGADAEVLEPVEVRGMVGEAARRLAG